MNFLSKPSFARWLVWFELLLFVLGLCLRLEHAITFDGPLRGSDYAAHLSGVRWMDAHWRPFYFAPGVHYQVGFYPPLWYALGALTLDFTGSEKALASFAIAGFLMRHYALGKLLRLLAPGAPVSRLCALAIHAVLPLSVLIDGKVNPEGLHAGFFTLAAYFLFRIEREANTPAGLSLRTASAFGLFAGLALLTKATGALLLVAAVALFAVRSALSFWSAGFTSTFRRLVRPALLAGVVWCAAGGWWCAPNLMKYGKPFPHIWDLENPSAETAAIHPLYRRPLGWALPFEWKEYWEFPILRTPSEPLPNFWAAEITGTWSDFYNRGFCRLHGGTVTDRVWGGLRGFMSMGTKEWSVNSRCVAGFATLLHVGVWLTLASVIAVFHAGWLALRSRFRQGSLVLPLLAILSTLSGMTFALVYPYDNIAVLNSRYLLPAVTPMCGCLGLLLARLEGTWQKGGRRGALSLFGLTAAGGTIAAIGALLLYIRFAP